MQIRTLEVGTMVSFRRWYEKRTLQGEVRGIRNGRYVVRVMHRAAVGGNWVARDTLVKPEEIIA